jgi:hypothetical protein
MRLCHLTCHKTDCCRSAIRLLGSARHHLLFVDHMAERVGGFTRTEYGQQSMYAMGHQLESLACLPEQSDGIALEYWRGAYLHDGGQRLGCEPCDGLAKGH